MQKRIEVLKRMLDRMAPDTPLREKVALVQLIRDLEDVAEAMGG